MRRYTAVDEVRRAERGRPPRIASYILLPTMQTQLPRQCSTHSSSYQLRPSRSRTALHSSTPHGLGAYPRRVCHHSQYQMLRWHSARKRWAQRTEAVTGTPDANVRARASVDTAPVQLCGSDACQIRLMAPPHWQCNQRQRRMFQSNPSVLCPSVTWSGSALPHHGWWAIR